jgi:hypothetical protein
MANLLPADEKITKVTPRDQVTTFHNFFSPLSYLPIGYDSKGSYIPVATSNSYIDDSARHSLPEEFSGGEAPDQANVVVSWSNQPPHQS